MTYGVLKAFGDDPEFLQIEKFHQQNLSSKKIYLIDRFSPCAIQEELKSTRPYGTF